MEMTTQTTVAQIQVISPDSTRSSIDLNETVSGTGQPSPITRSNTASPTIDTSPTVPKVPPGWERYVHPNGLPYFFNKDLKIVTYDDINDSKVLTSMKKWGEIIPARAEQYSPRFKLPDDYEFFFERREQPSGKEGQPNSKEGQHLLVDHTKCRTMVLKPSGPEINNKKSVYWDQVRKTPMHRPLPSVAEDEMFAALMHYYAVRIHGALEATSPFSRAQCEQLISLYTTVKRELPETDGARTWFVSHVLCSVWKSRNAYRYGEMNAIPRIDPPSIKPTMKEHVLDAFLLFACFGTHLQYRKQLLFAQTHGGIHVAAFQKDLEDMLQQWTDSNLLGTVFVSADVAFLSVQGIQRPEQAIVLASTLFAIASIISGVHHLWKHRSTTQVLSENQPYDAQPPIETKKTGPIKTTLSAVFLSFPLVFLQWSISLFLVGLLVFAFRQTTGAARVVLAFILGLVGFALAAMYQFFFSIWNEPLFG